MTTAANSPVLMYGTAWKEDRTESLVDRALQTGYRAIDTANQRRHYYEEGVGNAVKKALASGLCKRGDLFLQTKFTYVRGQDHRLPYDPAQPLATQVEQSMKSSLEHLGVAYLDSYVLHGPASGHDWTQDDVEVWSAIADLKQAGLTREIGVSNVSLRHLERVCGSDAPHPTWVQNRCYARTGWDREIRAFCRERKIRYQGFSLLTANPEVVQHRAVASIANRLSATPAQIVLRFAQQVGMTALTGTTDPIHMSQDLECSKLELSADEVRLIESLSG